MHSFVIRLSEQRSMSKATLLIASLHATAYLTAYDACF